MAKSVKKVAKAPVAKPAVVVTSSVMVWALARWDQQHRFISVK